MNKNEVGKRTSKFKLGGKILVLKECILLHASLGSTKSNKDFWWKLIENSWKQDQRPVAGPYIVH